MLPGGISMAKTAASPPAKPPTITLKTLAHQIAGQHRLSVKQSEQLIADMVDLVTQHLKNGDRLRIGGLGILQVRKRPARMGRNPATGEPVQIGASKKIAFRASKELKVALDEAPPLAADDNGGSRDWP
jgi:DNA-binding protein HU-beta